MASKDFSRATGPRLRVAMSVYEPSTRRFKPVKNAAALISVDTHTDRKALWEKLERAIANFAEERKAAHAGTDSAGDSNSLPLGVQ